jgi:hypothetical protein
MNSKRLPRRSLTCWRRSAAGSAAPARPRASFRAARRQDRRAARAARASLERDLASYTSPGDLNDLDAILDRYSDEETAEIRRILAARRAALVSRLTERSRGSA